MNFDATHDDVALIDGEYGAQNAMIAPNQVT